MNSTIVLFLDEVEKVNMLVEADTPTAVFPLVNPGGSLETAGEKATNHWQNQGERDGNDGQSVRLGIIGEQGSVEGEQQTETELAELLVYVRFFNKEKKEFCEDLLGVTTLQTSRRGEDIYLAIKKMLEQRGIEPKQVGSVITDGAPTMHHMLREFLREVDANADDLLVHNNVRWLSKGRVLKHFWSIQGEIAIFLAQLKSQKDDDSCPLLPEETRDVTGFSNEVTQLFKWANAGHLQMQLIDLQADVALKECFGEADPATNGLRDSFPRSRSEGAAMSESEENSASVSEEHGSSDSLLFENKKVYSPEQVHRRLKV
ncbi:hypothetical protein AOLI_G00319450 [Acnodon oligacanthus]